MPWYALISHGEDGNPIKRELLFRDSKYKVLKFIQGRLAHNTVPEEVWGFFISTPTAEETWDFDIDEPLEPSNHAIEVSVKV